MIFNSGFESKVQAIAKPQRINDLFCWNSTEKRRQPLFG
jgi:hypothetical protein